MTYYEYIDENSDSVIEEIEVDGGNHNLNRFVVKSK